MAKSFAAALILFFLIYSYRLDLVPVHLNQDELAFSLNAKSITQNLHDTSGNFLPFYFWHLDSFWATPVIVYWSSIFLKVLPLKEEFIRLPTVFLSTLTALVFALLALDIFKQKRYLYFSIFILAITPAFFINSRLLLDNIYPLFFVVFWLFTLNKYLSTHKSKSLFLSGLSLGIGIHSYHAAKIYMPLYFLATIIFLYLKDKRSGIRVALAGFIIPVILFIPWLRNYPDTLLNQVSYAASIDSSIDSNGGVLGLAKVSRIKSMLTSYFAYFSPRVIFFEGDRTYIHSTLKIGIFPLSLGILILLGIIQVIKKEIDVIPKLALIGLLLYPVAPSLLNDPGRVSRGLVVIPFAVLLSLYGIKFCLKSKEKTLRLLVLICLSFSLLEFVVFQSDYFGEYRQRSYSAFNKDINGVMESALKSTKTRKVSRLYLDSNIPYQRLYYSFYQNKFNNFFKEFTEFSPQKEDFTKFGNGSLVVVSTQDFNYRGDRLGNFEKIEVIREPDGTESFYIFFHE